MVLTTTPSSAEVKEIAELYLYSTYGISWPVVVRTLLLPLQFITHVPHSKAVQLKPTGGPRYELRTTLRVAHVYTDIEKG